MSGFSNLGELLATLPAPPKRWNRAYLSDIIERANKRIRSLEDRIGQVTAGRTMPDLEQVAVGSGKHFRLSVLFLDICQFTSWPSKDHSEQRTILKVMDIFMAEMMNIVRDYGGTFEKNTGDGLMAYFGTETSSDVESVQPAVEAAVVMHYFNDVHISPWLVNNGWWPVRFRIGIDYGEVTIGRVGAPGGLNSFVAIGSTANIACRLLEQTPDGGICIGNEVYPRLPLNWYRHCVPLLPKTGYVYVSTNKPYPVWQLNYRLSPPGF